MTKIDFKGSVVLNPVPVVLITSKNSEGKDNVFTVAWTGTLCTHPPMLSISVRPERLSYEYIKETMEFTVNIPNQKLVKATDFCGVRSGKKVDKIKEMNFTMCEGTNVNSKYIDECPINIECKVKNILSLGSHDVFIAEVLGSHIDESLLDEKGKIHFEKGDLITYCHGEYYPMPKDSIGSFGFSVAKRKLKTKTTNEKNISNKNKTNPKDNLKEKNSNKNKAKSSRNYKSKNSKLKINKKNKI